MSLDLNGFDFSGKIYIFFSFENHFEKLITDRGWCQDEFKILKLPIAVKFLGYLAIIRVSSIFCKWYDPSIYEFWINGSNKGRHSSWSCSPMKLLRIKNNFSVGNRRKPQHNFGKCFEKYGVLVENQETRMKTVFWKIQFFFFFFLGRKSRNRVETIILEI